MDLEIKKRRHKHFDLTPLIDIMFNLLLFFILTYKISSDSKTSVSLPRSTHYSSVSQAPEIVISAKNEIYFLGKLTNPEKLSQDLKNLNYKGKSVNIRADKNANVQVLIDVADSARKADFNDFNIITAEK